MDFQQAMSNIDGIETVFCLLQLRTRMAGSLNYDQGVSGFAA